MIKQKPIFLIAQEIGFCYVKKCLAWVLRQNVGATSIFTQDKC